MAEEPTDEHHSSSETQTNSVIDVLGIRRCQSLSTEEEIRAAGFDLDAILSEQGISAKALHDAMFLTEGIARTTLGTNYERIVASAENYKTMISNIRPRKVVDLGGGCGLTCFDAAATWADCQFHVCDRSNDALQIGSRWAAQLQLANVSFHPLDFVEAEIDLVLGNDNDLVVFEYVLPVGYELEDESHVIAAIAPGMQSASRLVATAGKVCVRFGEFSEHGLTGLIRTAYRTGLFVHSISAGGTGFTFMFSKESYDHSEDAEVFCAMDDLGSQIRALDPGE